MAGAEGRRRRRDDIFLALFCMAAWLGSVNVSDGQQQAGTSGERANTMMM